MLDGVNTFERPQTANKIPIPPFRSDPFVNEEHRVRVVAVLDG